MGKANDLDLDGFVSYVEAWPSRIGCWRDGESGRYPTLAWLNVKPVVEQRSLAAEVGHVVAVGLTTSAHHNQVGIAADWVTRFMRGPGRHTPTPDQDREALWTVAGRYWSLRDLIIEVRVGLRGFESHGTRISLPYCGNHNVDALDRMLDLVERLDSMDRRPRRRNARLQEWLRDGGRACPWDAAPDWVRAVYRAFSAEVLSGYPTYLPSEVIVAGFSIGELDAYWQELMARGMHMSAATLWGSEHPATIVPIIDRADFVDDMAVSAGIGGDAAERITSLLTMDSVRCPDPALTPLVPIGRGLLPMSSLIMPAAPHRNTLAIVQADPNLFGEAGRLLGEAGEHAMLSCLGRMSSESCFATRVKVRRGDGSTAGDLDVVVCDPKEKLLAVFEIKWHIAADGNVEVYKAERAALAKRSQVVRLRGEIENGGAVVRWPAGWPDVSNYGWRWFVLTRDVLAMREVTEQGITLRSFQLLARMLRKDATVKDLIDLLDDPPIPPAEICATQWDRMRFGDLRIDAEMIIA